MQRDRELPGKGGDGFDVLGNEGADAVHTRTEPHPLARRQSLGSLDPAVNTAVPKTCLGAGERLADPAGQIAGVDDAHSDPRRLRRGDQCCGHRVRIDVRLAPGPVVQVVELADRRYAREHHLGEGGRTEITERIRLEHAGERVHRVAPRPEVTAVSLDGTAQCALEAVRVAVRKPRNDEAEKPSRPGRRRGRNLDPRDRPVSLLDENTRLDATGGRLAEERSLAPEDRHLARLTRRGPSECGFPTPTRPRGRVGSRRRRVATRPTMDRSTARARVSPPRARCRRPR